MSIKTKQGLVAALESIEDSEKQVSINNQDAYMVQDPLNPNPDTQDVQPVIVPISMEELEAELEIERKEKTCDDLDTEINEAVASANRLERLQEFSDLQGQEGGMSRQTAEGVTLAIEAIMANVGVSLEDAKFPALENFGGVKSRFEGNSMAMESIGENVKKVWEFVIRALKAAAVKMVEYAKEFSTQAGRIKQRSERLRRYAEGVTGVAGKKTFTNASLASRLSVNGIVNPNILSEANRVLKTGDGLFEYAKNHTGVEFTKLYIGAVATPYATINDVIDAFVPPTSVMKKSTSGDHGLAVYETDRLPGEFVAFLAIPEGGSEDVNYNTVLTETQGKVERAPSGRQVRDEIPLLSISDCIQLLQVVETMMERVMKFEPLTKEFKKNRETLAEAAQRISKNLAENDKKVEREDMDNEIGIRYGMLAANRVIGQPAVAYARYMTSYARALTQYVESALATYGKGEE